MTWQLVENVVNVRVLFEVLLYFSAADALRLVKWGGVSFVILAKRVIDYYGVAFLEFELLFAVKFLAASEFRHGNTDGRPDLRRLYRIIILMIPLLNLQIWDVIFCAIIWSMRNCISFYRTILLDLVQTIFVIVRLSCIISMNLSLCWIN